MNNNAMIIQYKLGDTFLEKLSGVSKVLLFLSSILLMMASFDLRLILPLFILQCILLYSVYKPTKGLRFIIQFMFLMNMLNILLFYLVNPTTGTELAGSSTVLFSFNSYFVVTKETLFYFVTRILKIFGTLLISLWFILSITPTQMASGFYTIHVPYKYGTMMALGLRYMPDVLRDYRSIKESMQMRGVEFDSKRIGLMKRVKLNAKIILPLVLVSFDRIEVIASAMDLRGYGQQKKRSYYADVEVKRNDKLVIAFSITQFIIFGIYMYLKAKGLVPELWIL